MKIKEMMKIDEDLILVYSEKHSINGKIEFVGKKSKIIGYGLDYAGDIFPLVRDSYTGRLIAIESGVGVFEVSEGNLIEMSMEALENTPVARRL